MKTRYFAVVGIVASSFLYLACDDGNGVTEPPGGTSSSSGQTTSSSSGGGDPDSGAPKDCFDPPFTTHLQIINACTNADKIVRSIKSSKYQSDGGLPKP